MGNMLTDQNKGITNIKYNHLNLPTEVVFSNGKINYTYDAIGTRVSKKVEPTSGALITTDYVNGFQYENNELQFFPHAEGYVKRNTNNTYLYVYQYKDHLGNVRLSYADINKNGTIEPASEILEENNYYPFGLLHKGYNNIANSNRSEGAERYKFNGMEWQPELGLDLYDFKTRNYDPAIGRWLNVDPLAEKYFNMNPYGYALNNPIYFIDPDGRQIDLSHIRDNNKEAYDNLINELQQITGYTLVVDDNGNLTFATEKNSRGKEQAIINKDKNGKDIGSKFARKMLRKAIKHKDIVTVSDNPNGKSRVGLDDNENYTNEISLDFNEIGKETYSPDLTPLTHGIGMVFLHELGHTPVGGGYHDPIGEGTDGYRVAGSNENRINKIRRELGPSYGQRMIYNNFRINMSRENVNGQRFRAYSPTSLNELRNGQTPSIMYSILEE